jgi:gas vesicle protein
LRAPYLDYLLPSIHAPTERDRLMREYDDLPYIVIERRSAGITPFLWGALLGVGAALLLAPRSGEETQEEIRQGVRRLRTAAEGRANEVRDNVTGAITRTRGRIQDQIDSVRDTVEERAEQARHAIEAGRRAAQEARGELERRVGQAKASYSAAADAARGVEPRPTPSAEVVVTEVIVEEAAERPDLG